MQGGVGQSESWTEVGAAAGVVCSRPKVVIRTTDPIITPAAIIIRDVKGSLAKNQPIKTATTGFTYAYVAARAGVTFFNNQL